MKRIMGYCTKAGTISCQSTCCRTTSYARTTFNSLCTMWNRLSVAFLPLPLFLCCREAENGEGHCKFHKGKEVQNWNRTEWSCCHSENCCASSRHRSKHHNEYPYNNFFAWANEIKKQDYIFFYSAQNCSAIKYQWINISIRDLEEGVTKEIQCGLLVDKNFFILASAVEISS